MGDVDPGYFEVRNAMGDPDLMVLNEGIIVIVIDTTTYPYRTSST